MTLFIGASTGGTATTKDVLVKLPHDAPAVMVGLAGRDPSVAEPAGRQARKQFGHRARHRAHHQAPRGWPT